MTSHREFQAMTSEQQRDFVRRKTNPPRTEDKLAHAREQGQSQFDSIKEMVEAMGAAEESDNSRDFDAARQAIEGKTP